MKQKSFVLRSSRITSKTFSTITPSNLSSIDDQLYRHEHFPSLDPSVQGSSQKLLHQELSQKDKQLSERLKSLNSNLKYLEKQYRQNLKDGFDHKIKSYRLQAVMERKMLKQTIDETLRINDLHDIKEKQELALKRKQFSQLKAMKQQQIRENHLSKLKQKSKIEQRKNMHELSMRQKQLASRNKSLHDRIMSEEKYKDRKKNYLEFWRQEQLRREQFQTKKQFLQRIVMNTRKIKGLKQQLQNVEQRCQQLIKSQEHKNKSSLFVTI